MFLGPLGASLLGNILIGKYTTRTKDKAHLELVRISNAASSFN